MSKNKNNGKKLEFVTKHRQLMAAEMKKILANEGESTFSDSQLAELLKVCGVYATKNTVRQCRTDNKIPCSQERRLLNFKKKNS